MEPIALLHQVAVALEHVEQVAELAVALVRLGDAFLQEAPEDADRLALRPSGELYARIAREHASAPELLEQR